MKIGILTLPLHINYGGILQAYALQTILERMGHKAEILMPVRYKQSIPWLVFVKRIIRLCIGKNNGVPVFYELICNKLRNDIDFFVNTKINISRIPALDSIDPTKYDAIVVGSDQIWRKRYFCNMWKTDIPNAFLYFAKEWPIKKIAYGASFGVDEWQFDETETCQIRQCLTGFNAISVRETSAVELLKKQLGCEATHVLDPTLLLSAEDYLALSGGQGLQGGLVSYILDHSEETDQIVNSIATAKGLVRRELNRRSINEPCLPVEDWIRNIASADLVVTNSFHGCVFGIIFRKPLIFMGNENRGNARFASLMETFGLESNSIADLSDFNSNLSYELPTNIDERIIRLQVHSINFFIKSLSR